MLGFGALCCEQVLSIDGAIEIEPADASIDARPDGQGDGPPLDERVEDGGMGCGITVADDDAGCGSCVSQHCCAQMSACAGDPQCRPLETCLLGCGGDYACRSACVIGNQVGGQADVPTLDTCVAINCRGQCGMPCGQAGSYTTPPDAAPACETCIAVQNPQVCTAALSCATSLACEISGHCAYACTTPDCRAACASDGGDDSTLVNAAFTAGALCYTPCRIGRNWTCVNSVVWPEADAGAQQATLTLNDAITFGAVPGVSATACRAGDDGCTTPLSTGTSTDAGVVSLAGLGAPLIFGFEGHFELTATSYISNLYYLSFPLSQPDAHLTLSMLKQADLTAAMAEANIAPVGGTGTVWAQVEDCLLLPAQQVVVKADGLGPASVIYYAGGLPSRTATSTDATGWAFLYNVSPGPLTLHAVSNDTGIESSQATVHVRAGDLSVVTLLPTELP